MEINCVEEIEALHGGDFPTSVSLFDDTLLQ